MAGTHANSISLQLSSVAQLADGIKFTAAESVHPKTNITHDESSNVAFFWKLNAVISVHPSIGWSTHLVPTTP